MSVKTPFRSCFNPKRIVNRYTSEELVVNCGVCKACLAARASRMTTLCNIEREDYKFCYFVTLTYSNQYVPRAYVVRNDDLKLCFVNNKTPRLGEVGEKIACFPSDIYTVASAAIARSQMDGDIMYLSKRDVQLFLKRLRKQLTKVSNEKLRYYCIGEYGPQHLRPHYHLLFFFDSQEICEAFAKGVIHKAWPFGRVDWSSARNGCSAYVAQYVNCNCALPQMYSATGLRPFSTHSLYFASSAYKAARKEIYEAPIEDFVEFSRLVGERYIDLHAWRSLQSLLFPKCFRYVRASRVERLSTFRLLLKVREWYGPCTSLSRLTDYVYMDIVDEVRTPVTDYIFSLWCERCRTMLGNEEHYYPSYGFIYSLLVVSKHFLMFCCDGDTDYFTSVRMLDKIDEYYSRLDYSNLREWYTLMSDYSSQFGSKQLVNFYDNFKFNENNAYEQIWMNYFLNDDYFGFQQGRVLFPDASCLVDASEVHRLWHADVLNRFENTIKHKKQNDNLKNWFKFFNYE